MMSRRLSDLIEIDEQIRSRDHRHRHPHPFPTGSSPRPDDKNPARIAATTGWRLRPARSTGGA